MTIEISADGKTWHSMAFIEKDKEHDAWPHSIVYPCVLNKEITDLVKTAPGILCRNSDGGFGVVTQRSSGVVPSTGQKSFFLSLRWPDLNPWDPHEHRFSIMPVENESEPLP